jgi:hypothetical protein
VASEFIAEFRSVTFAKFHKSHELTQTATDVMKSLKTKARSEAVLVCVRWLATDRVSSADAGFPACSALQPSTTQACSFKARSVCDSVDLAFLVLGWILGSFKLRPTLRHAEEIEELLNEIFSGIVSTIFQFFWQLTL